MSVILPDVGTRHSKTCGLYCFVFRMNMFYVLCSHVSDNNGGPYEIHHIDSEGLRTRHPNSLEAADSRQINFE